MPSDRARLYHEVLTAYVQAGVAPHYVDIANALGWSPDHARTVSWLFPGREVRIDSHCPDCGESIDFVMRDGELLSIAPETVVAHINLPVARWRGQYPLA